MTPLGLGLLAIFHAQPFCNPSISPKFCPASTKSSFLRVNIRSYRRSENYENFRCDHEKRLVDDRQIRQ